MIDLATALWNQRSEIRDAKDRLFRLQEIVNWPGDMPFASCIHLYAFCLEFAPDLIVEVGRGYGNSTCMFTEAANRLKNTKVVSVGYDGERCWATRTAPALRRFVSEQWFEPLEIIEQDALTTDFSKILSSAGSALFFWDAHGLQLANYILAEVLPHLRNKRHVTLVHDINDVQYYNVNPSYEPSDGVPQYFLGELVGPFEELMPLYDFLTRNRINYDTPRRSLCRALDNNLEKRAELQNCWGPDFPDYTPFDIGGFIYFDLNNRRTDGQSWDLAFPKYQTRPEAVEIRSSTQKPGQSRFRQFRRWWRGAKAAPRIDRDRREVK